MRWLLIIIILLVVSWGIYYWWMGTPEYSIRQFRRAVYFRKTDLALKYLAIDSIVEHCWVRDKSKFLQFVSQHLHFSPVADKRADEKQKTNLKKYLEQLFIDEVRSSSAHHREDSLIRTLEEMGQTRSPIARIDRTAYFTFPGQIIPHHIFPAEMRIKVILTRTEQRYWQITDVQGWGGY